MRQPYNAMHLNNSTTRACVRAGKQKGSYKQAGQRLRDKMNKKRFRRPPNRTLRTGRELCFKGLTFILWWECINRLGVINPPLAMRVYEYAHSKDRKKAMKQFWNNQKGDMKRDFELAANLLMEEYGSNTSPEGRVIVARTI